MQVVMPCSDSLLYQDDPTSGPIMGVNVVAKRGMSTPLPPLTTSTTTTGATVTTTTTTATALTTTAATVTTASITTTATTTTTAADVVSDSNPLNSNPSLT